MVLVDEQVRHGLLPTANHDERARQYFTVALKQAIFANLTPAVREIWLRHVEPLLAEKAVSPGLDEVRLAMMAEHYVRVWSAFRRSSQEMLWEAVLDSIERELDDITERVRAVNGDAGGTLELDPTLEIPDYLAAVDIHCMPTGYHEEVRGDYDIVSGVLYDRGGYLFSQGSKGPNSDEYGRVICRQFLQKRHPDFRPSRILDMGCTVGQSTLPYVDQYPDAEVYAIDLGAPVLRYGHARAEKLGRKVHFSQQNAERTTFEDGYFDLIVSHILMHETSRDALRNIFAECYRLLAPGGLMAHMESRQFALIDDRFMRFIFDWETHNNNEPFFSAQHEMDLEGLARSVGFDADGVTEVLVPTEHQLQTGIKASGGNDRALIVAMR